jgi:hypothetical protein
MTFQEKTKYAVKGSGLTQYQTADIVYVTNSLSPEH